MAWKTIPGLIGRVYVPEVHKDAHKKHDCKDCFCCQICGDDRCSLCEEAEKNRKSTTVSSGCDAENP